MANSSLPSNKVGKLYKPLRLAGITWLGPVKIFIFFAVVTGSISYTLGKNLATPLNVAYILAVCAYLADLHQRLLIQLKPVLDIDNVRFEEVLYSTRNPSRGNYRFGKAIL